jgi:UDP-3-O-[3-hydroxymyristoyl] glucosamine N-acyltransferase
MEFTALEIATFLGGDVIGDPTVKINNVSKIEEGKPGTLAFLANLKYAPYIYTTNASVVLVSADFIPEKPITATQIRVKDPYLAMSALLDMYVQSIPVKIGIEIPNFIDPTSEIGKDIYLGAFCYIGKHVKLADNVKIYPHAWIADQTSIGANTVVYSGAKIYPGTIIGKNCVIHSGAVIGADGFGFAPLPDGTYKKMHQVGNVIIEDNVEIGANATIDCATMGSTRVKKGAKIDNLVQIAHNVIVGEDTLMAAQTGIAGSTIIGDRCVFGGQVGIAGHLKIGDNVKMAAKTGITNNVGDNMVMMGTFGLEASRFRRNMAVFRNLPELAKQVNTLNKDVRNLKSE